MQHASRLTRGRPTPPSVKVAPSSRGLERVDYDGNRAQRIRCAIIMVGSSIYISQAVIDGLQFKSAVAIVVLKELHDPPGPEEAIPEKIADDFNCREPHVSAPNDAAVHELPAAAGIEHDLPVGVLPAALDIQIEVIVRKTQAK